MLGLLPGRGMVLIGMLLTAAVGPYMFLDSDSPVKKKVKALMSSASDSEAPSNSLSPFSSGSTLTLEQSKLAREVQATIGAESNASLAGEPVQDLGEVLRFDISPRWVMDRWSRVSSALAERELQGLRVPLVTGTAQNDLAGSLTYYFDRQQRVQRISLHGFTGDERKLSQFVMKHYGLERQSALNAGLFLAKWNGKPTSLLRVTHASVMRTSSPNSRLEINLELNRPGANYGLSSELTRLLEEDKQARRW